MSSFRHTKQTTKRKSSKTNTLTDELIQRTSSKFDEIESKFVHKKIGKRLRKKMRDNKAKPIEKIHNESSELQCSIKVVFKYFTLFTRKYLCWSVGVSNKGVALWILRNFKSTYYEEHLRTAAFAGYLFVHPLCCRYRKDVRLTLNDVLCLLQPISG